MRNMTEKDIEIYCRMRATRRDKLSLLLIEISFIITMSSILSEGWFSEAMIIFGILPVLSAIALNFLSKLNKYTPKPYSFPIDVPTVTLILFLTALLNASIENIIITSLSIAAVLCHLIFCIIVWTKKHKEEN